MSIHPLRRGTPMDLPFTTTQTGGTIRLAPTTSTTMAAAAALLEAIRVDDRAEAAWRGLVETGYPLTPETPEWADLAAAIDPDPAMLSISQARALGGDLLTAAMTADRASRASRDAGSAA